MATSETSHKPGATPWALVSLLGALTALGPVAIDMYLPSLPAIGVGLHATAGQTQATVATFLAGMAIGQILYGPASDRFGRRPPLLLGIGIFVAASVLCALATTPEMLLAGRFVQGCGACAGAVIARAAVRDQFDHTETARVLSLMMLIMGVAPILSPLVGGALLSLGGWRLNFWVMFVFGLAVGLAALLRMKETRSEETSAQARSETPFKAYAALFQQPRLLGYGIAGALNSAVLFTWIANSADLLIQTYGISPGAFGWVFGANAVGVIGGNQINRILLRRISPDRILARASLFALAMAMLLAAVCFLQIGGALVVLPLLFVTLGSFGFIQGNTMAGALNIDPRRAGSISAMMGAASFGAGALASTVSGALHDGTPRPLAVVVAVSVAGSFMALRFLALPKSEAGRQG